MTEDQARTAVLVLMAELGIPCYPEREPRDYVQWDGVASAIKGVKASNLFHDVAHWLLCPKTRRAQPDFGLGRSPDSGYKLPAPIPKVFYPAARLEEEKASVLGILLEARAGMKFQNTIVDHGWREARFPSRLGTLAKVMAKKFPQYVTAAIAAQVSAEYKNMMGRIP